MTSCFTLWCWADTSKTFVSFIFFWHRFKLHSTFDLSQEPGDGEQQVLEPTSVSGLWRCENQLYETSLWHVPPVSPPVNPPAVVHRRYRSSSRLLSKHICVSVVKPFLLHPPLNKLYGGQEAKTEQLRSHYALFTQKWDPSSAVATHNVDPLSLSLFCKFISLTSFSSLNLYTSGN